MPDPYIIAELAQGYEGEPTQALALLEAAAASGADAAKFQLVYAEELATPDYQHYALFRKLEMPDGAWRELAGRARELSIDLELDVFGSRSLALAEAIAAQAVKVHSTDMGNPGLLEAIARSSIEEVLLSTAGCTGEEIQRALRVLGRKKPVLLHGFQGYPTPTAANQILRLREFAERYPSLRLGFADHADPESALSVLLAAAALGAGATVIEKHLTLDRSLKLEDHESALNPGEFAGFVRHMRECSAALGAGLGSMHDSERDYRRKTRKHVVAVRNLKAGAVIASTDVALKRTASPVFVQEAAQVVGRRLGRAVKADEAIRPDALEEGK
jgi:N,N'-diacetyllegionaminate synthase